MPQSALVTPTSSGPEEPRVCDQLSRSARASLLAAHATQRVCRASSTRVRTSNASTVSHLQQRWQKRRARPSSSKLRLCRCSGHARARWCTFFRVLTSSGSAQPGTWCVASQWLKVSAPRQVGACEVPQYHPPHSHGWRTHIARCSVAAQGRRETRTLHLKPVALSRGTAVWPAAVFRRFAWGASPAAGATWSPAPAAASQASLPGAPAGPASGSSSSTSSLHALGWRWGDSRRAVCVCM
jgi:hypothetical protein